MKKKYIVMMSLLGFIWVFTLSQANAGQGQHFKDQIVVNGVVQSFEVEAPHYSEAEIDRIHWKYDENDNGKNYLILKGSVKNLQNRLLSGAVVVAHFFDENGNLVRNEYSEVIPRIIRLNGSKRGRFTVKVPYDKRISLCKLDMSCSGRTTE
jgi:hypothetical protein